MKLLLFSSVFISKRNVLAERGKTMIKRTSRTIGIMMLLIFVFGILSIVYVLEKPDYLVNLPDHINQVYIGGLAQMVMVIIYMVLLVLVGRFVKSYQDDLFHYFTISRAISIVFHLLGIIMLMLFIPMSDMYLTGLNPALKDVAELLRLARDLMNHLMVIIPYLIGSFIFYYVLDKTTKVSQVIIKMGYIGISLACLASLLILFNVIDLVSPAFGLLSLPLALQEILLALILIRAKYLD